MFTFALFILSGVVVAALLVAKMIELRGNKPLFILRAVSKGDERARDMYHKSLKFYSDGKVKVVFFVKRELPVRAKIYFNKGFAWVNQQLEEQFGDMRNSRLLSRREGISEFIKNISEIEKGGELHEEIYAEPGVDEAPLAYRATPAPVLNTEAPATKPKKPRAPRKPRTRKVPVVEVNEY